MLCVTSALASVLVLLCLCVGVCICVLVCLRVLHGRHECPHGFPQNGLDVAEQGETAYHELMLTLGSD